MASLTTETLWRQLKEDLFRFLRRRLPDDATAEDLLQDVFLRIHRNLGQLSDQERVAGWVYQIARNRIADYHRSPARSRDPLGEVAGEDPDRGEDRRPARILGAWLVTMIDELPATYREAVRLSEIEGLPQREIAERLGLTLSGAKSRVQRGRAHLLKMLEGCCEVERDRRGRVIDFERRSRCCDLEVEGLP